MTRNTRLTLSLAAAGGFLAAALALKLAEKDGLMSHETAVRVLQVLTGLALAVYRIVQESLTNTRKHGGSQVRASVALIYTDDCLVLRIVDNGRGAEAPGDGMGHGLVGMRERVSVFGGTLVTGPHVSGGYAVEAILPFPGPESADRSMAQAESQES